jgi:hypothetical protein
MWLLPAFIVSFFLNEFNLLANDYNVYILSVYLIFFALYYFTSKPFFYMIDKLFLLFFAVSVFMNNKIFFTEYFIYVIVFLLFIVGICFVKILVCKKNNRKFFFRFKKISAFLELSFILSVLFLGIKSQFTSKILFVAMFELLYQITVLSVIINLKKRFNML